ncbi:MAG: DUF6502 family protein [Thermodesulfobacteriota bacterium]
MATQTSRALAAATDKILRSLARVLLRHGVAYGEFAEWAKRAFVAAADDGFGLPGRRPSASRAAVLTGLSRKEVTRLRRQPEPADADAELRYNRAARVVSAWVREPGFQAAPGADQGAAEPAPLPAEGPGASFSELVRRFSGDVPARAVLDELLRVGTVARLPDGRIELLERSYVPRMSAQEKIEILGTDVSDLIAAIGHNLDAPPEEAFFQRKVSYDNLPDEASAALRREAGRRAQALIEELDRLFARHDRDVTPEVAGAGRKRLVTGVYVFEEDVPAEPPPLSHGEEAAVRGTEIHASSPEPPAAAVRRARPNPPAPRGKEGAARP